MLALADSPIVTVVLIVVVAGFGLIMVVGLLRIIAEYLTETHRKDRM